ncbi:zinc finger protein CONSTANS-LIKE 4-like [Nicotiana tomentosiformis]|uniref:zinc finger protein CONSTANS-LIKE 4-like n=1 Tax=Nicotiana tomentosiformis TaxID=4098 RepID=UPI00051C0873|nr:zinc finger protein CONSTANS-LIKE 4-like [Nicotiana tomentosiformis]
MKNCELCKGLARMYCESDNASLCWDCDAKVHSANFLAARHSRSLLCHVCQSPTAWSADGPKLGPTVSVCERCVDGYYHRDEVEESESVNDEGSTTEDEENDDEEDEDEEIDDEEDIDQVVPWSSTPPPPPASSSSSEDSSKGRRNVSLKRMREYDADLHSDDDNGSSLCSQKIHTTPSVAVHSGDEVAAVVVSTKMRTPAKIQRTEANRTDRLTAPGCTAIMEYIRRNNRQRISSSTAIVELCRLSDDSRTVDLESSETS